MERTRWALPSGTPATPAARNHVTAIVGRLDRELALAARALTSEIVTAALMRGRAEAMLLEVAVSDRTIRVEVTASFPREATRLVPARATGTCGGMMIVDALATDWGVMEEAAPGKDSLRIWFRLSLN